MAAALWEIVAKASNLAQLVGLDAVTLVAIAASLLRSHRRARTERRRLEESARTLESLLLRTPAGRRIMASADDQQPGTAALVGELAAGALRDARELVASHDAGSTLLSRVRSAAAAGRRFRELRGRIDSYCGVVLAADACRRLAAVRADPPPPLPPPSLARAEVNDGDDVAPSTSTGYPGDAESSAAADDDIHIIIDIVTPEWQRD
ncbi:hypothetical protein ACP4OV_001990 [Aristida adscensionis]